MTQYAESCYLQTDRGQKLNCTAGLAYNLSTINSKCTMLNMGVNTRNSFPCSASVLRGEVVAIGLCPNAET